MVLDIRAQVYCSLGTVISGSFADDYLQGNGLIKTRGEVVLQGTQTPAVGTQVSFTYVKGSNTYTIPRVLRVLSSFADPFRRTTTVQLGCKLTYLENRKPPVEDPSAREEHSDVPCRVYLLATLPISAEYVLQQCLDALELTSAAIPLTSSFSVEEFDLTPGYLQVMSDLLQSEGYVGYLDSSETLQFIDLTQDATTGPVFTAADIIDLGPIGVGDLPGESVVVRYNSLRLLPPEELYGDDYLNRSWEMEEVFGAPTEVSASYENDEGDTITLDDIFYPYTFTATRYDTWDRKIESITLTLSSSAEVNNRWASDAAAVGALWNVATARISHEELTYEIEGTAANDVNLRQIQGLGSSIQLLKNQLAAAAEDDTVLAYLCRETPPDGSEIVLQQITTNYFSELELSGSLNIDSYRYDGSLVSFDTAALDMDSQVIVEYETDRSSGVSKTVTKRYVSRSQTVSGQQDLASKAQALDFTDLEQSIDELLEEARPIVNMGAEILLHTQREYGLQRRPREEDRNTTNNEKPVITEQRADIAWVTGSTTSTAVTEFTVPYAPDDEITWDEATGEFNSIPSDAREKALRYGRIQNRLLLGNRSGVSLQITPEQLPSRPFAPIYLEAGGITGNYRVNGSSWAFDANGIAASTDALLWGAVSATAEANLAASWVPLAPGTTSLPEPYPTTAGGLDSETGVTYGAVITPSTVLPPYRESVLLDGISRSTVAIRDYPYLLDRGTQAIVLTTRSSLTAGSRLLADVSALTLAGQSIGFRYERSISCTVGSFALNGYGAGSVRDYEINTNSGTFVASGQNAIVTYQRLPLSAAAGAFSLSGQNAQSSQAVTLHADGIAFITSGIDAELRAARRVDAAQTTFSFTGQDASIGIVEPSDDYFSSVELLLKGEGTDGATTITDSSSNNRSVATNSGAVISTAQFKYGTASILCNATSTTTHRGFTYTVSSGSTFGTGDYTIEMFIRFNALGRLHNIFAIDTTAGRLTTDTSNRVRWLSTIFTPSSSLAVDTWYHLAVVRDSGSVQVYIDGTQAGSTLANTTNHTGTTWYVGRDYDFDLGLYGYIDELRVTKGVARYSGNFTPPSRTFPEQ